MPTSYTDFVSAVAGLSVSGVKRAFTHIPNQLNTTDLPASFVRLPDGQEAPITADGQGGWPTLTVELVVAVEARGQDNNRRNYAKTLTLMDAVSAALRGVENGQIGKGKIRWSVRAGLDVLGETEYWLVVARVSGNG